MDRMIRNIVTVIAFFSLCGWGAALDGGVGGIDVTSEGTPSASSVFPGFSVQAGVDGDSGTNWYSDGCFGGEGSGGSSTESYYWTHSSNIEFSRVELDPETMGGFGFTSIRFIITDSAAGIVYTSVPIPLPGFDVDLVHPFPAGTIGTKLEILLTGHENCACGGFAELRVFATPPTPPTVLLRINGDDADVVTSAGPVKLTLTMDPGTVTDPLGWFFVIIVQGQVFWITGSGVSSVPGVLLVIPPLSLTDIPLIDTTLAPPSVLTFVFFLFDGTSIVSLDFITSAVF